MINKLPTKIVQVYDRIITQQQQSGFIEQVTDNDTTTGPHLPHH